MDYKGEKCPICGREFIDGDDIVVCPECGTPYHRACWSGRCVNEQKHGSFVWSPKKNPESVNTNEQGVGFIDCPVCGAQNPPGSKVCRVCGSELKAENTNNPSDQGGGSFDSFGGNTGNGGNFSFPFGRYSPYQNPAVRNAQAKYGMKNIGGVVPVGDAAEYIQRESDKYIGKMIKMDDDGTKLSWNWSAFIFSFFWCFYRKMITVGIAMMMIFLSITLLSNTLPTFIYEKFKPDVYAEYQAEMTKVSGEVSSVYSGNTDQAQALDDIQKLASSPVVMTSAVMQLALDLIASVVFGFFANYFYKKRMIQDVQAIREIAEGQNEYHIYLLQRGGVSVGYVLLAIFLAYLLEFIGFIV